MASQYFLRELHSMHHGSSIETWFSWLRNSCRLGGVQRHGNGSAPAHNSMITENFFGYNQLKRLLHQPHSPDISFTGRPISSQIPRIYRWDSRQSITGNSPHVLRFARGGRGFADCGHEALPEDRIMAWKGQMPRLMWNCCRRRFPFRPFQELRPISRLTVISRQRMTFHGGFRARSYLCWHLSAQCAQFVLVSKMTDPLHDRPDGASR
jgi:hypothetical protein